MRFELSVILFLFFCFGNVYSSNKIENITTAEECLSLVDSLLEENRFKLRYFDLIPFKELTDEWYYVPELKIFIFENSLINWEKFDLNQDGCTDLYFSVVNKSYQPLQGFVIGNNKDESLEIYIFDQYGENVNANPNFQLQERTNKKNVIVNYRFSSSKDNSCNKVIKNKLLLLEGIGFVEIFDRQKLVPKKKINSLHLDYFRNHEKVVDVSINFKTRKYIVEYKEKNKKKGGFISEDELEVLLTICQYSFSKGTIFEEVCSIGVSHPKQTNYELIIGNKKAIFEDKGNQSSQAFQLLKKNVEIIIDRQLP